MTEADPFAALGATASTGNPRASTESKRLATEMRRLSELKTIPKDKLRELLTLVSIHGIAQALEDGSEKSMLDWSKLLSAQTGLTKVVEAVDEADLEVKIALQRIAERQNAAK